MLTGYKRAATELWGLGEKEAQKRFALVGLALEDLIGD